MTSTQDHLEEHLEGWLKLLIGPGYKDRAAQNQAVSELKAVGATRLFPLLIPMLNSPTLLTRCQASRAILSIDEKKGIELLLPFLNDPDREFRYDLCGLMHDFGDSRVIEPLIKHMQNDPDPQFRGTAAYALGGIGDPQAIPALINTRNNDHEFDEFGYSPSFSAETAINEIREKSNRYNASNPPRAA